MKPYQPELIEGGSFSDGRGKIRYVNDFHFDQVRRFYLITHHDTSVVRAWHGHRKETKHFHVSQGSFVIAWVKIDDFTNPSSDIQAEHLIMSASQAGVLTIPPGYANGLKAMKPDSQIIVFSDLLLHESQKDDVRYDKNLWFDWGRLNHIAPCTSLEQPEFT